MKVVSYDEGSNSLLVCFASDTTKSQDPAAYKTIAYQPDTMWPDVTDPTKIPELIAQAGLWQVKTQETMESLVDNPQKITSYKALVGQSLSFDIATLLPQTQTTTTTTS